MTEPEREPEPRREVPPAALRRGKAMIMGFLVGSAIGVLSFLGSWFWSDWPFGFALGIASALAGTITGVRRRHVVYTVVTGLAMGAIVALYMASQGRSTRVLPFGGIFGASTGVLLGPAISALIQRRATKKQVIEDRSPA